MALPIPTTLAVLLAKLEATFATAETLTNAAAGFRVKNPRMRMVSSGAIIPAATGRGDSGGVPGAYHRELGFDVDLYGGNWMNIFLPSCGWKYTAAVSGNPKQFAPSDVPTDWSTLTAQLQYSTSKLDKMFGAMGSFNIKYTPGGIATASFKFKGVHSATTDAGISTSAVSWESSLPAPFMAAGALVLAGNSVIPCASISFEQDDYVVLVPSPDIAGGYLYAWLKKPAMRLKIDPLETSAKDYIAEYITTAGTTTTGTLIVDGGTNNKLSLVFAANSLVLTGAPDRSERDEQLTAGLEYAVLNNGVKLTVQ